MKRTSGVQVYRRLFGVRDFRLLISGQAVSTTGDMLYAVALPWLVLGNGGSAQVLGDVLAAYSIPRVATVLAGGWLSDRLGARRVMLVADVLRAGLVGVLALLAAQGHPALWQIVAVAMPLGACEGLFLPASFAIMPIILDADRLQAGNAINGTTVQLANLIGPGVGGFIVGRVQSAPALALDAATFVASALTLWLMRGPIPNPSPSADGAGNPVHAGGLRGAAPRRGFNRPQAFLHLLRTWRLLQVALVIIVVGNLTIGGTLFVALPALARGPLHAGAAGYGAMLATFGGGALLGGLAAGAAGRIPRPAVVILLLTLVQAAGLALLPLAGGVVGAALALGVAGLATGITNVLYLTLVQREAPPDLLGQIMGVFAFASLAIYPISVTVAGIVATRSGPAVLFPITGLAIACAVAFGLSQRAIWRVGMPAKG
jgi:MFS family permease